MTRSGGLGRRLGRRLLVALLLVLVLGGCGDDDPAAVGSDAGQERFDGFPSLLLRVLPAGLEWCVLLADTAPLRQQGLMDRHDLGGYDGMLFEFGTEVTGSFWMRDTPLPLSIGFFDGQGAFVSSADMAPCGDRDDCARYGAAGPYRWALEVPQGGLDALGVGPGARIEPVDDGRPCHTPGADS